MKQTKVTLRSYPISKNRRSLYFDYYPPIRNAKMKMARVECLGIYIVDKPRTSRQRQWNEQMMEKAEIMRCQRSLELINENIGFIGTRNHDQDFLAYFKKEMMRHALTWKSVYLHFCRFSNNHLTFGELNFETCKRFRDYLLDAPMMKNEERLTNNTAAYYLHIFKRLLKNAFRDKKIREDLSMWLEDIKLQESRIEYLTKEELNRLAQTPCNIPVLKRASLFACLTGLRVSDILLLTWENIVPTIVGNGYDMRIKALKTGVELTLPLSDDALKLCGERSEGTVFKGLIRSMTDHPMKQWVRDAGITKHITFHSFRHTYAVLQLAAGEQVYTVSRLLGHKHISTTERYVDLVDDIKRNTVNNIPLNLIEEKVESGD